MVQDLLIIASKMIRYNNGPTSKKLAIQIVLALEGHSNHCLQMSSPFTLLDELQRTMTFGGCYQNCREPCRV